ncbi:MAG: hypothetical protein HOW73_26890 [Polyangiaceae bacterium]|nr:hypothetical protein [Polyangiaceae bacterium]
MLFSRGRVAIVCVLSTTACVEVMVDPSDGAGGAGGAGSSSTMATVGGGGSTPHTVAGCDTLEWVGEPLLIEVDAPPRGAHLTVLEDGRVGVAYIRPPDDVPNTWVRTLKIGDPFAAWPPAVGSAAEHSAESLYLENPSIDSRSDGTFVVGDQVHGIFDFDEVGILRRFDDGVLVLEPRAGGGVYRARSDAMGYMVALEYFPSAGLHQEPTALWTSPISASCPEFRLAPLGSELLLVVGPESQCGGQAPVTDVLRLGSDRVSQVTVIDLPFLPVKQWLLSRPGGYWYAVTGEPDDALRAFPLGPTGELAGDPWVLEAADRSARGVATWRNGLAVASNGADGARIAVLDGTNVTYVSEPDLGGMPFPDGDLSVIIGGSQGQSILVAYQGNEGVRIRRADCSARSE